MRLSAAGRLRLIALKQATTRGSEYSRRDLQAQSTGRTYASGSRKRGNPGNDSSIQSRGTRWKSAEVFVATSLTFKSGDSGVGERRFEQIIGSSHALAAELAKVERVAPTDSTVLVLG